MFMILKYAQLSAFKKQRYQTDQKADLGPYLNQTLKAKVRPIFRLTFDAG